MTKFTRLILIVPLLSAFAAASLSAALASRQEVDIYNPIKERHQDGGKSAGSASKGAGSPTDAVNDAVGGAVNNAVGGAVGNAVGGLLGAFGPK